MPEYSNYVEAKTPIADEDVDGTELLAVSKDGVARQMNTQQIADLVAGGGGTVTSVSGTTNRISVDLTNPAIPNINIDVAYDAIVAAKAPLASPTFTGTPAAPTAAAGANTTQIATTAFVLAAQLGSTSTSTAGGTITLDMNSQIQRMHVGSASFATPKTIAMSNTTGSLVFNLFFEVTDIAAVITVPASWIMADIQFDGTAWTPPQIGKYELGGSFDGTNWFVKIQGPFA